MSQPYRRFPGRLPCSSSRLGHLSLRSCFPRLAFGSRDDCKEWRETERGEEQGRDVMGWRERTKSRRNVWANGTWQDGTEDLRNRPFTRHILHPTSASLSHPLPSARSGLPSPPYRFAHSSLRGEWHETGKIRRKAWDSESDVMLSAPLTIPSPNRRWRGT